MGGPCTVGRVGSGQRRGGRDRGNTKVGFGKHGRLAGGQTRRGHFGKGSSFLPTVSGVGGGRDCWFRGAAADGEGPGMALVAAQG